MCELTFYVNLHRDSLFGRSDQKAMEYRTLAHQHQIYRIIALGCRNRASDNAPCNDKPRNPA